MVLADSFYYQPVQIDTINTRVNADLFAKEGDANGRGMVVQITENGIIKDTTGITLRLQWSHISVAVSGFTDFEVVDATKGLYKLQYPTSMLHRGRVEAFIRITDNGILAGTRNLLITVERMVGSDETIEASDDFSALQTALTKLSIWEATISGKVGTWEDDMEATKQLYIDTLTATEAGYPQELVSLKGQFAEIDSQVDLLNRGLGETFATLVALQAAYPTGDTKDHIVGADGHRYFWDDTAWVDGGAYQAVELVDGVVDLNSFNPMLKSNFGEAFTALDMTFTDGGYYNRLGNYVAGADQMYMAHTLVKGDVVKVTGTSYLEMPLYVFVGADNSDTPYPVASGGQTFVTDVVFEATQNGTLYINKLKWATNGTVKATKLTAYKVLVNNDSFENGVIGIEKLKTGIQDNFVSNFIKQTPSYTAGQYYNRSGALTVGESYSFVSYAVVAGDFFKVTGSDYYNMPLFIFIANSGGKTVYPAAQTGGTMFYNADFVATEPGTLYINKNWIYNPVIYKNSGHALKNNPLYNKLMYADGDSVARGQGSTNGSYVDIIAANNAMGYKKSAVGGTTLAKRAARTDSILERVQALTGTWDYILLEGGFNDLFGSIALGTLTSGFVETLDEFTVIGAAESLCKTIKTNYPNAKTLFVLGHRIGTGAFAQYPNQDTYWDAVITALNKWSIPYVDIRKEGGLCAFNQTWLTNYFGVGETMGTHPNYDGYLKFYVPLITAKMKAL